MLGVLVHEPDLRGERPVRLADALVERPQPAGVEVGVADFVRIAGRDLDPGKALLTGRLDLEGDLALAARLGEMFGQPSAI